MNQYVTLCYFFNQSFIFADDFPNMFIFTCDFYMISLSANVIYFYFFPHTQSERFHIWPFYYSFIFTCDVFTTHWFNVSFIFTCDFPHIIICTCDFVLHYLLCFHFSDVIRSHEK